MKIGIIGTRGIPNNYGGFEQFAELFGLYLVDKGHVVTVYNASTHSYKKAEYRGVRIIHKYDPEDKIGTAGQFVYDGLCILDSRKRDFDVILQLGYTSSSIFSFMFPKSSKIFTNMDGLEWKRSKYNKLVQRFLKRAEKWAVKYSDHLIADSIGIQNYISGKYHKMSEYIPYGAEVFKNPSNAWVKEYSLDEYSYNLIIARFEPENKLEVIIQAHLKADLKRTLVLVGSYNNSYGRYLQKTYVSNTIKFLGPIYDSPIVDNLRYYSNIYFHGHSVGGTNPSLIEAMACSGFIIAHKNEFNNYILGEEAYYFEDVATLSDLLKINPEKQGHLQWIDINLSKVENLYNPEVLFGSLESLFKSKLNA